MKRKEIPGQLFMDGCSPTDQRKSTLPGRDAGGAALTPGTHRVLAALRRYPEGASLDRLEYVLFQDRGSIKRHLRVLQGHGAARQITRERRQVWLPTNP